LPKYLADEELPPLKVISSFAHGKEWINSVRRARESWLPGLQNANDRGIQAIFLHLGIYFDYFTVQNKADQGLVLLQLLDHSNVVFDADPLLFPFALFKKAKKERSIC
jgi:hypothetical protein